MPFPRLRPEGFKIQTLSAESQDVTVGSGATGHEHTECGAGREHMNDEGTTTDLLHDTCALL